MLNQRKMLCLDCWIEGRLISCILTLQQLMPFDARQPLPPPLISGISPACILWWLHLAIREKIIKISLLFSWLTIQGVCMCPLCCVYCRLILDEWTQRLNSGRWYMEIYHLSRSVLCSICSVFGDGSGEFFCSHKPPQTSHVLYLKALWQKFLAFLDHRKSVFSTTLKFCSIH